MKRYVLIAGVNGAGKSTLYPALSSLQGMERINTDEIVKEFGDWKNNADVMTAGKKAVRKIKYFFDNEISFNHETTLCGKTIFKYIDMAKEKGYLVELHYVGVDTVDIAKERIRTWVQKGGHGISDKDVERRYTETFKNLKDILPLCDITAFYDNTEQFHRFAIYKKGICVRVSSIVPDWYERFLEI